MVTLRRRIAKTAPDCNHCGGCGAVRGDDVKFYLPDDAQAVENADELRRANAGPDWQCPYCGGDNPGYNSHCSGCGSPQDGTEKRQVATIPNERWQKETAVNSRGNDNKPAWPEVETGPKRRVGPRQESYKITLAGKGKTYTFHPKTEAEFIRFSPSQPVEATVTNMGIVTEIRPK